MRASYFSKTLGLLWRQKFTYVLTSSVVTALSPLMSYICKSKHFLTKVTFTQKDGLPIFETYFERFFCMVFKNFPSIFGRFYGYLPIILFIDSNGQF